MNCVEKALYKWIIIIIIIIIILYGDSLAKNCVLSHQLRANESTDVFKSISAHSELLTPRMILLTIYNELFEPKLRPWIDPHSLALTAMYVVLALNCQDYNVLLHPPHLLRHKSHPLNETPPLSQKYGKNQY